MGDEGTLGPVPPKGADPELHHGELLRRILHLEVPDVGAVELKRVPPRGARDAGHLEIDGDKVRLSDPDPEVLQRWFEVGLRHLLHGHASRGSGGGGGGEAAAVDGAGTS